MWPGSRGERESLRHFLTICRGVFSVSESPLTDGTVKIQHHLLARVALLRTSLHLRDLPSRDRQGVKELVCQPEAGKEHVEICGEALRWAGSGREVGHYRSGAIEPQRESGRGFVQ